MRIREAIISDIPGILKVLKASLGESSSKKTEEVWRYKHINNPFGTSLVLIAEDNNEIVGVRAFMRWKWQNGEMVYSAFRAVDTATHPDYQGKGIFKKLTLRALELGKQRGDHFVFNTPNTQSKPGYLKMGWKEVGKLNLHLIPVNPIYWKKKDYFPDTSFNGTELAYNSLITKWEAELKISGKLFTPKTFKYLSWRYINNPLQQYKVVANENFFIAGYVKKHSQLRELRISELIFSPGTSKGTIKRIIRNWAKEFGVQFISVNIPGKKTIFRYSLSGNFGPIFTYRQIAGDKEHQQFLNLNFWEYSLGDLELF